MAVDAAQTESSALLHQLDCLLTDGLSACSSPSPGHPTAGPLGLGRGAGPTKIRDYLYLGSFGDAECLGMLTEMGITHLLNCAGTVRPGPPSPSTSPMGRGHFPGFGGYCSVRAYHQLEADDNENYDMASHVTEARRVIGDARSEGGKVLVYCRRGVNRSAMMCVAHLVLDEGCPLVEAVGQVAAARGKVLTNPGFRYQLVQLSRRT